MNFYELLVIGIVALIVFGPEQMPQLAYRIARYFRAWQRLSEKIHQEINNQLSMETLKKNEQMAEISEKDTQGSKE